MPGSDISDLPQVLALSSKIEEMLGTSGGPPVVRHIGGHDLVARKCEHAILLGGPWDSTHVAHELVHWHMDVPAWDAIPQGLEEGLAVIIATYLHGLDPWYGDYVPGDESVLYHDREWWLEHGSRDAYLKAARSVLALGIPELLSIYGRPVPEGFEGLLTSLQ